MSKVVLVFDEPEGCFECLAFENEYYHGCRVNGEEHWEEKPKWCPLRPLPERKHPDGEATIHTGVSYEQGYIDGHEHGWDACLYEITGEEDE